MVTHGSFAVEFFSRVIRVYEDEDDLVYHFDRARTECNFNLSQRKLTACVLMMKIKFEMKKIINYLKKIIR